jgi:hypothetical protein
MRLLNFTLAMRRLQQGSQVDFVWNILRELSVEACARATEFCTAPV